MKITILPSAKRDLEIGFAFYSIREKGLASISWNRFSPILSRSDCTAVFT